MDNRPIGVFDSGLGGISVLGDAIRLMPSESFLYYGDTFHAPYGDKSSNEVFTCVQKVVEILQKKSCKAIVLACNTATAVAAKSLRATYSFPIIGMEPALKPASLLTGEGKVLVMATKLTLSQEKFRLLMEHYGKDAIPVPCSGLVEWVEQGKLNGVEIEGLLRRLFAPYAEQKIKAIVLGCTHYVFLRHTITKIIGDAIPLVDGNVGTVRELQRRLSQENLLAEHNKQTVEWLSSATEEATLLQMKNMLNLYLQGVTLSS